MSATDGSVSANYEYGAFGEVLRCSGALAKLNPFRFSTKYQDDETDLVYYGSRYYQMSTGRWLSRDWLEEDGGANIYGFVQNRPVSYFDYLGYWSGAAHDAFMEHALGKKVKPDYLKIIKDSNRRVDNPAKPTGDEERHYMYPCLGPNTPNGFMEMWKKKHEDWIENRIAEAHASALKGNCDTALKLLGQALHAVNDSESPVHRDAEGNPKCWKLDPEHAKGHSQTDKNGNERSRDITPNIYRSQDTRILEAYDRVFDSCPCKAKIEIVK